MITRTAFLTVLLFAGLGLIISRPIVLLFLNTQSPEVAFFLWYLLLFAYIEFASFVIFRRFDLSAIRGGLGIIILVFGAGIIFYWAASGYALTVVGANPQGTPPFLLASEDQLVYNLWRTALPFVGNDALGFLTYVVTPALLVLLSSFILSPKVFDRTVKSILRAGM